MTLAIISEQRVNQLISAYGVWELEYSFTSFDTQDAQLDILTPIDFGNSIVTPNNLMSYDDVNKEFTVLKSGCYMVKTRQRAARVGGSAGESELFIQAQASLDGGTNWINTGNSVDLKLDDSRQVEIFFDMSPVFFPAGIKLRQVMARSSNGTNFGTLLAGVPSAALSAAGMSDAPAAQTSIYKLRGFNYT